MGDQDGMDAQDINIEELAMQFLGKNQDENSGYDSDEDDGEYYEEEEEDTSGGHPAWQEILSQIPQEYHAKVMPTLADWDAGVSRRFQKIHDEYAPYRGLEEVDPDDLREAIKVYQALQNDPASTWETIGRVYGLSPNGSQASSSGDDEDDFDLDSLPASVRDRLSQIDKHDQVIEYLSQEYLQRQAAEEEEADEEALEEVLGELAEEYGDFDEDYVVGLIAAGVDPEEAVGRFQEWGIQNGWYDEFPGSNNNQQQNLRVMSGGGGIPDPGGVDVSSMSNQDTQSLITELLRMSQEG